MHPAVQEAVVVLREEERKKYLVAYVVTRGEEALTAGGPGQESSPVLTASTLQEYLREQLPDYMVPTFVVFLETMPLTPHGKVDRSALLSIEDPLVQAQKLREPNEMPVATVLQELLGQIWKDVLALREIGIHDNFFELGGHSLLATQVVARIGQTLQVDVPLRSLFDAPTIAALASRVEELLGKTSSPDVCPLVPMARSSDLHAGQTHMPLSFAQERLWFLSQWDPNSAWYNIPMALRLAGSLNVAALERSLAVVVQRHEVLRTTFSLQEGRPVQVITPELLMRIPVIDLQGLASTERDQQARQLARTAAHTSFDLEHGPLLRLYLLRLNDVASGPNDVAGGLAPQEQVLLFTLHHIVADGWSMGILVREITTLYQVGIHGEPDQSKLLPQLPVQYADYALWQRQWLQGDVLQSQMAYWREQLAGAPALLELPTDRPRPAVHTHSGARQARLLAPALLQQLKSLSQREGVTLFMTLLATFQVLLMRYSGKTDIVVGSPIAHRTRAELEHLIGFFLNTVVLRTDLSGNPSFQQLLARVREVALQAYMHQDIPFEKLVEETHVERSLSYSPVFQVLFILQNTPRPDARLSGLTIRQMEGEHSTTWYDLSLVVTEGEQGLLIEVEYRTDLFHATTVTFCPLKYSCSCLPPTVFSCCVPLRIGGFSQVVPWTP